jgi:hypothetical protein
MHRACIVAGLATATLAVSAFAMPSPVRLDRPHGVRFDLTGSVLTVRLVPQRDRTARDARKQLWGKRIDAICSPTFNYRKARRLAVRAVRFWPRGQMELSYTFGRDISDRVKWCLLEDGARDIAGVSFEPFIPVYGDSAKDRRIGRQLRRYLHRNVGSQRWLWTVSGNRRRAWRHRRRNRPSPHSPRQADSSAALRSHPGADVADFTPGHTVYGDEEVVLRVCPARRQ